MMPSAILRSFSMVFALVCSRMGDRGCRFGFAYQCMALCDVALSWGRRHGDMVYVLTRCQGEIKTWRIIWGMFRCEFIETLGLFYFSFFESTSS